MVFVLKCVLSQGRGVLFAIGDSEGRASSRDGKA